MKNRFVRRGATLLTVASIAASSSIAHAYNWNTHKRMVEVAVSLMRSDFVKGDPPPDVNPSEWTNYVRALEAAPARLELLSTGLPNGPAFDNNFVCKYDP